MSWYTAVTLGLGRIRQEDLKFQARLGAPNRDPIRKQKGGVAERWLSSRLLLFLSEDPGSVPSICFHPHHNHLHYSSRGSHTHLLPSASSYAHSTHSLMKVHTCMHTYKLYFLRTYTLKQKEEAGDGESGSPPSRTAPHTSELCWTCVEFCGESVLSAKSGLDWDVAVLIQMWKQLCSRQTCFQQSTWFWLFLYELWSLLLFTLHSLDIFWVHGMCPG